MKDLVKENGNQATVGSIPQLFIPNSLREKMLNDEVTWSDLRAADITQNRLRAYVSQSVVPRLVVEEIIDDFTNLVVGSGAGTLFSVDAPRTFGLEVYAGQTTPLRGKTYTFTWYEGEMPYLNVEEA